MNFVLANNISMKAVQDLAGELKDERPGHAIVLRQFHDRVFSVQQDVFEEAEVEAEVGFGQQARQVREVKTLE